MAGVTVRELIRLLQALDPDAEAQLVADWATYELVPVRAASAFDGAVVIE